MVPFISIVIPTHSRPVELVTCCQALCQQDYPRDRWEVIIVDDGSPQPLDDLLAPFREPLKLTLIRQAQCGPAMARNQGASYASGQYIAFTDDDCLPAKN